MGKRIDLKGRRFNRLLVIAYAGTIGKPNCREATWQCKCDCGNTTTVRAGDLMSGKTQSCGCFGKEKRLEANVSHGMSHNSTYSSWKAMKKRCNNPNEIDYKYYGGRGVIVCTRWKNSFENFYSDMGEKPKGLTLERIDNNKGYSPENCYWATRSQQSRNTRTNRMIIYRGKKQCVADWADEIGINYHALYGRLRNHPPQIAFNM
jgi:hypothetical protein